MTDIRPFVLEHLLEPLKHYPTAIQDTMIEIIIQRLQELYDYTVKFPEIVSPDSSRLDILKAISDQFLFTIRDEADIQEQVDILDNILYVYNRRGSLDTIENMWKYYGGDLPKDVKVIIPSYNLFRYSVSALSGTHAFIKGKSVDDGSGRVDRTVNSPGVYEIRLINNNYPIPDLKEFLLKELVAAGTEIYFTNVLHMDMTGGSEDINPYRYLVLEETFIQLQLEVARAVKGLTLSGYSHQTLNANGEDSYWSGNPAILLELTILKDLGVIDLPAEGFFYPLDIMIDLIRGVANDVKYTTKVRHHTVKYIGGLPYCTPDDPTFYIDSNLSDEDNYIGYFLLGKSLLGEEIGVFM